MSKRIVRFRCPYCSKTFEREPLIQHVADEHDDMIPEGYSALRVVFDSINKYPIGYNGKCTECGGPTGWDEKKGRYNRQCNKKSCHESYLRKFETNMNNKTGVTRISSTPEGQEKMLANRRISGTYKFQNGVSKTYTGSYELKALEFMDKIMNINPDDLMCPGPVLYYPYEGKDHIYITDFYYIPYNLVIEVKDGGKNPNKRDMPEYRAKQIAKEEYLIKNTNYNYLRLTDNDLSQLLTVFMDLKLQLVENTGERVIHVNEASKSSILFESNDKTIFDEIKKFNSELNKWDYGVLINGKVVTDADKIDWSKYKTIPIKLIDKYHVGICWDFVNYEAWWMSQRNIKYEAYFFVMSRNEDNTDIITHTFITIAIDGELYWFESSWFSQQGLHKISSFKDVIKILRNKYGTIHPYDVFKYNPKGLDNNLSNTQFFNRAMQRKVDSMETPTEAMNALTSGYIPGFNADGSVVVVNYMQNNVFSGEQESGIGFSDSIKLDSIFMRDKEGVLRKAPREFLERCNYNVYLIPKDKTHLERLQLDEFCTEEELQEALFGQRIYAYDQIQFLENVYPIIDFYKSLDLLKEATMNYFRNQKRIVFKESEVTVKDLLSGEKFIESSRIPELYLKDDGTNIPGLFLECLSLKEEE